MTQFFATLMMLQLYLFIWGGIEYAIVLVYLDLFPSGALVDVILWQIGVMVVSGGIVKLLDA